jgi:hypothetical protein
VAKDRPAKRAGAPDRFCLFPPDAIDAIFGRLAEPTVPRRPSAGFIESMRDRYSNLWRDRSSDGRRQLLSLAFRNEDSTGERADAIKRASRVARLMLNSVLVLADSTASSADVSNALMEINTASVALDRAEPKTQAQAELISAINEAAAWVRAEMATVDRAAACALEWFERRWPTYASDGSGPAFRRAVEAWLGRGNKKKWAATAEALTAVGIRTSADNAKKVWQRWRAPGGN